ncbi:MAG: hypothetical protein AAFV07_04665 [Bacteroidota bacterium]
MKNTRCQGWWEQGPHREEMEGLMMQIEGGVVTGSGYDVVGMFTFEGSIDDAGNVSMIKTYMGKHAVGYQGMFDGNRRMSGLWKIHWMAGPWEILFRDEEGEQALEKQVEVEVLGNDA